MRKTKIIATIGPSSIDRLPELIKAGMNVARFNFSHGDHEEQKEKLIRLRKACTELNTPIAALLDTRGPEIRLKDFENGKTELKEGQTFTLTSKDVSGTNEIASITYPQLISDVSIGDSILIDDGLIRMTVSSLLEDGIVCTVQNGGKVSDHKGINVPGVSISMPYISESDREDILFGIKEHFDYLAASFVRCKEDILNLREILKENNSSMKIIAKIENMQGIDNIDEIIAASDGIMVARGDLGVEIPLEKVPSIQKMIIRKAVIAGKPVITATQMLESMIHNPRPTRAESTDVANAIYDGTTAIMLSGETAAGAYPVEAVATMSQIAEFTEQDIDFYQLLKKTATSRSNKNSDLFRTSNDETIATSIAYSACTVAMDLHAAAIITVTLSGFTASAISRFKPDCPIISCTIHDSVARQMSLLWGVNSLYIRQEDSADNLFTDAIEQVKSAGYIKSGDLVVITAGLPLGMTGKTNMIRVICID